MDFNANQVGHRQRLSQHRIHVFQVCQQRFSVDVAFAAEYFVAVDRELIEKITRFVPRFGRKLRQNPFKCGILSEGTLK